jgi:hypothetical protein
VQTIVCVLAVAICTIAVNQQHVSRTHTCSGSGGRCLRVRYPRATGRRCGASLSRGTRGTLWSTPISCMTWPSPAAARAPPACCLRTTAGSGSPPSPSVGRPPPTFRARPPGAMGTNDQCPAPGHCYQLQNVLVRRNDACPGPTPCSCMSGLILISDAKHELTAARALAMPRLCG